jgi:hypothetical protein
MSRNRSHSTPIHPDVRLILQGSEAAKWYGDGPPQWQQGRKKASCQTAVEAVEARRKAIRHLDWHGAHLEQARTVRSVLASCKADNRCLSGACPVCMRAFQRWFVAAMDQFIRRHPADQDGGFKAVSLVPDLTGGRNV